MQALILAAGRGSRLGRYSPDTPKCLLEVGRRRLIDHQLEACAEAGIAPVCLVVGYCADEIREVVGIRAEYVNNPRWATTNSMYSFWQARDWIKGPVLVMNCDIIFEPAILARLLAAGGDALAYDSSSGSGIEHMKIKVAGGRVLDMSKGLPPEESAGENLGMIVFSAETASAVMAKAGDLVAAGGDNAWLAAAVREVAHQRPIRAVDVAGLRWGEIDSATDLHHVRRVTWPAIKHTTARQRSRWRWARWAALPVLPLVIGTGIGVYARSPSEATTTTWETVQASAVPEVEIEHRNRAQSWWLVGGAETVRAEVEGPAQVRIESRLVLPGGGAATTVLPYVLRVEVDGQLFDLFKKDGKPDGEAHHKIWSLARRKRVAVDLPAGRHALAVSLVDTGSGHRCLVRVRTPDADSDAD